MEITSRKEITLKYVNNLKKKKKDLQKSDVLCPMKHQASLNRRELETPGTW